MLCDKTMTGGAVPATVVQDLADQAVVLQYVLDVHPDRLTIPELVRELNAGADEPDEGDAYERAVRDLTGIGLLRCPAGIVEPTRAALRFHELGEA